MLTFDRLGCSRGGRKLFEGVSSVLHPGAWMYVTGANGAGKTSLLRMLCGLTPVEVGGIFWNGQRIDAQRDAYCRELCYLGHLNALQESLSVAENLDFNAALAGRTLDVRQRNSTLGQFGLQGRQNQLVRHLSQGQKRRVALSRLVVSAARLWVLDEPFVAMDEAGVKMLATLIADHLSQGGLAVVTSHQLVDIGAMAPTVVELGR